MNSSEKEPGRESSTPPSTGSGATEHDKTEAQSHGKPSQNAPPAQDGGTGLGVTENGTKGATSDDVHTSVNIYYRNVPVPEDAAGLSDDVAPTMGESIEYGRAAMQRWENGNTLPAWDTMLIKEYERAKGHPFRPGPVTDQQSRELDGSVFKPATESGAYQGSGTNVDFLLVSRLAMKYRRLRRRMEEFVALYNRTLQYIPKQRDAVKDILKDISDTGFGDYFLKMKANITLARKLLTSDSDVKAGKPLMDLLDPFTQVPTPKNRSGLDEMSTSFLDKKELDYTSDFTSTHSESWSTPVSSTRFTSYFMSMKEAFAMDNFLKNEPNNSFSADTAMGQPGLFKRLHQTKPSGDGFSEGSSEPAPGDVLYRLVFHGIDTEVQKQISQFSQSLVSYLQHAGPGASNRTNSSASVSQLLGAVDQFSQDFVRDMHQQKEKQQTPMSRLQELDSISGNYRREGIDPLGALADEGSVTQLASLIGSLGSLKVQG